MNEKQDRLEELRELDQRLQDYLSRADSSEGDFRLFNEGRELYREWHTGVQTYIGSLRDLALLSPEIHSLIKEVATIDKELPEEAQAIVRMLKESLERTAVPRGDYVEVDRELLDSTLSTWLKSRLQTLPSLTSAVDGYMETVSTLSPTVIRDSHVLSLIREYLEVNYRDVIEFLAKEPRRDWIIGAPDEEDLKNLTPLRFFLYKSFDDWERDYGASVPDVAAVSVPDVYRSVEDTLQEWATTYGFSLKDRGPAIYPRELAPYLSTSKIARRFHELNEQETEFIGGRTQQLQHRRFSSAITAPDATSALELSQTHVVVSDAIGSLYHSHREETGEQHARFTLAQITQQVMGNTKPTAPQQREVKASIEFLRRHMIHAHGEIVSGERIDYDDFLLSASATSVTNRMGNSVTGYKVRDYPVVFDISRRQEQARQLDALLSPRPGGEWWPSRLEEMTVYHMVCRLLFTLTPGKDGYSIVEDKELQQGLGGKYAPEHITARGRRTVREYREAAVKELQARGFIVQYDDYKPSRSVLGARIRIADKFPALKISPDNKRRIERS